MRSKTKEEKRLKKKGGDESEEEMARWILMILYFIWCVYINKYRYIYSFKEYDHKGTILLHLRSTICILIIL